MSSSTNRHHSRQHQQQQPHGTTSHHHHPFVPRNVIESVIQNLDSLISATSATAVLEHRRQIAKLLHFENEHGIKNFFRLKSVLFAVKSLSKWNRVASILKALDQKANQKEYGIRNKLGERKILVIGGGISGLRAAIELLLIGAKVICVEKRDEFSRNNVIHLWPNVINDMYTFEAKRLYGQFCVGSIDHISIRQLQLVLLKIAVIYGLKFVPNVAFEEICPRIIEPNERECVPESCNCCCHSHGFGGGAYAHFQSPHNPLLAKELNKQSFDVIIGCDGRRNTFSRYFPRNNRRGKLAIGLTANYVNRRTEEEAHCPEISGISRIYNQKWFKDLQEETGIELENIVYYRDETHYFVMTATKASLLRRGVLRSDYGDSHQLLSTSNIDISMLMKYSKDAAEWSSKLRRLEFALNSSHKPDVALFDFTSMYSATNASCAKKIYLNCCSENVRSCAASSKYTLMLLCGDSLLEPFWPTGSGAGRGFLSALDAAWTVSLWYSNIRDETAADMDSMLNVISRREYVYRLLAQTSPENTTPKNFSIDPQTRYKNLNLRDSKTLAEIKTQVRHLIIDKSDLDMKNYVSNYETKRARRATVGINPEDVLKAKQLSYKPLSAFNDEFNDILPAFSSKPLYSVPSSSSVKHPNLNCDNVPFEVIERKPKNTDSALHNSSHIDFKPRNYDESSFKKNYQARNHFLNAHIEESKSASELRSSVLEHNKENRVEAPPLTDSDYFDRRQQTSGPARSGPSAEPNHRLYDEYGGEHYEYSSGSSSNTKPYSWASRAAFLRDFAEQTSRRHELDDHVSRNQKAKKSSDIIEKAQYLEQKFEEHKKPYMPKLSKVGKIEDEDWNVKIWNSSDIFAPKVHERRNMVHDNSKALLQSRITQLNNNFQSNSQKDDILKSSSRSKVTNEYVNMLQNEVTSKFRGGGSSSSNSASNTTKAEPLVSVQLLKATDSTDSSERETAFRRTSNLKTVELLKPTGECKRCNKMITAIDRVSVLGQSYHRTCLTCQACSIMLRQDEIANDDFICKVCLKSRVNSSQRNARSSFFDNQMSASLIEAKKNFLVNIEQIDLRERAEFEIMDEAGIETKALNDLDTGDANDAGAIPDSVGELSNPTLPLTEANCGLVNSFPGEQPAEDKAANELNYSQTPRQQRDLSDDQSDLSESEPNDSSDTTNYTDDEHSTEDDDLIERDKDNDDDTFASLMKLSLGKVEEAEGDSEDAEVCSSGVSSCPASNGFACAASADSSQAMTKEPNATACTNADPCSDSTSDSLERVPPVEHHDGPELMTRSTCLPPLDFQPRHPSYLSYPNSDSSLVLFDQLPNQTFLGRTFGSKVTPCDEARKEDEDKLRPLSGKSSDRVVPSYRYSGQFTEKLYRTLSQPTLYEQLRHIDRKLKKGSALPPVSHEDLPFADSHEDLSAEKPAKAHAPVASIEDV